MLKFIERHKFFLILVLALATFAAGFLISSSLLDKKEAGAKGEFEINISYMVYWYSNGESIPKNETVTVYSGTYKSKDGNEYSENVGKVSIAISSEGSDVSVSTSGGGYAYPSNTTASSATASAKATTRASQSIYAHFKFNIEVETGFNGYVYKGSLSATGSKAGKIQNEYKGTSGYKETFYKSLGKRDENYKQDYQYYVVIMPRSYDISYDANGGKFSDGGTKIFEQSY